ncbi:hypothetical protein [Persicitalea sp.]|uniref:hypothetical protein n=1 Tax=Persicitalea sp. TaxID=3100273 RepID=UPI00359435D8
METLLIQLTHQNAKNLLLDLESMEIIKIVKSKPSATPNSQRLRGKLSDKTAKALQAHVAQSREEWDK